MQIKCSPCRYPVESADHFTEIASVLFVIHQKAKAAENLQNSKHFWKICGSFSVYEFKFTEIWNFIDLIFKRIEK